MSLFLTNSLKLAGLVSVSFILYVAGFFIRELFSEENCPEMVDFRNQQKERRRRFLLRKLHEQYMKQQKERMKQRKNDFYT